MPIDPNQAAFFLNPLEQMQRMDVAAEQRGPQLDRLKALARFDTTRANELEDEAKADELLRKEFAAMPQGGKQPASTMLSQMAQRAAAINPTAATKWFNLALTAANREQQAESAEALAFARTQRGKLLEQQRWNAVVSAVNSEGDVPRAVRELESQGMPPEDVQRFREIAAQPGGIEYLKRRVLTSKEQMTNENADADRALREKIANRNAYLAQMRLTLQKNKDALDAQRKANNVKAGGKLGSQPPSDNEIRQALGDIASSAELMEAIGDDRESLGAFARTVAGEAKALIASRPAGSISYPEARAIAIDRLRGRLTAEPTIGNTIREAVGVPPKKTFDATKRQGGTVEISGKADYDKLPKGAKYLWKGKEYTKE